MKRERQISNLFNKRAIAIVSAIALCVVAFVTYSKVLVPEFSSGLVFPNKGKWIGDPTLSLVVNLVGILIISLVMRVLNHTYNFIHSTTWIYVSAFLLLELSQPHIIVGFFPGTLLALVLLILTYVLFSNYHVLRSQRSIFATFAIITFCSLFNYAFLILGVIMLVGYFQLRAINIKGQIALLLGIITPFWIAFGFGIVSFEDFRPPIFTNVWNSFDSMSQIGITVFMIVIEAFVTIMLSMFNMLKIMSYKLQTRAYNGFWTIVLIFTIFTMAGDYQNLFYYLPLLNVCFAIQFAHFYTINRFPHQYIYVLILVFATVFSIVGVFVH